MIISFNYTIFQTQDSDIQFTLSKILVALLHFQHYHFIEARSISNIFFDETNKYIFNQTDIAENYLSKQQKQDIKDYITNNTKPITKLHIDHLTHLTIGTDSAEIHPKDAYKIITERSKIILENGINDWKFIKGICQKYSSKKIRRSIYQLLDQAIKNGIIEPEHAGGIGEFPKITQRWIDDARYHNIYQYKLMALFDSDKTHTNDVTSHTNLIEFLKIKSISTPPAQSNISYEDSDLIVWHILYKRKIENYIPLSILFANHTSITEEQEINLKSKDEVELDFIQYDKDNIGEIKIKSQFPEMFVCSCVPFSYRDLEERCKHHKIFLPEANEEVSEIEQILLKMAKII